MDDTPATTESFAHVHRYGISWMVGVVMLLIYMTGLVAIAISLTAGIIIGAVIATLAQPNQGG